MKRFRLLLRCVGGAVADHGVKCLLGVVPFADKLYDIARDAYERYRKEAEAAERLAQVEAAVQASLDRVRVNAESPQVPELVGDSDAMSDLRRAAYIDIRL